MLDKENIRQWFLERGYSGDGTPPEITPDIRTKLSERYIELFEHITGENFVKEEVDDVLNRVENNIKNYLQ